MKKILTDDEMKQILQTTGRVFYCFADNILEGVELMTLLRNHCDFLVFAGLYVHQIDQPVYVFEVKQNNSSQTDHRENLILCIKVCGDYHNWKLSSKIKEIIEYVDRPDVVLTDINENPLMVIETTETANVGNSQWQREGRKIGAARQNVPMIYQTYYAGTDRSQKTKSGAPVAREPTSLQVLNHLLYCLRYKTPSFVIYFPDEEKDKMLKHQRSEVGKSNLANYLALTLITTLDGSYSKQKVECERRIVEEMLNYVTELKSSKSKIERRVDIDFPNLPFRELLFERKEVFINQLLAVIAGKGRKVETCLFRWEVEKFKPWKCLEHKKLKELCLPQKILQHRPPLHFYSYIPNAKCGITLDTKELQSILATLSFAQTNGFAKLDITKPTLLIPIRIFKGSKKIVAGDPEAGEIVAFSELFAKDVEKNKLMNVVLYGKVRPPENFILKNELTKNSKLFKAIRHYGDLLIVDDKLWHT
jgi:hypothetical protein